MSFLKKLFGIKPKAETEKHPLDFTERTAAVKEFTPEPVKVEVPAAPVEVPVVVEEKPAEIVAAPVLVEQAKVVNKPAVKKATAGRKKKAK
jgi:hypothetical protein